MCLSLEGGESALSKKLASEITGESRGRWMWQLGGTGTQTQFLHQGLPTDQKVTDETENKHGCLFWDLDYSTAGRRIRGSGKGPGWGWPLQLLLPFSAFFCLLLWEPWPCKGDTECRCPGQTGKHEGCVSLHPPSNSLELFTLFSLPFLHFYNFLGTQG